MQQKLLTIDTFLALTAALINFIFIILIIARTSRTNTHIVFSFICSSVILWNFGDFMVYISGERLWFYLSLIGSAMLPALVLHFTYTLIRAGQKTPAWILAAYIFSGLLALTSPLAIASAKARWFVDGFYWNIYYFVFLFPLFVVGIVMLINGIRKASTGEEKDRLRYILFASVIGILAGFTDLVQIFRMPVPPLGHLGTLIYTSVLAIGVFKHRTQYDILAQLGAEVEDFVGVSFVFSIPAAAVASVSHTIGVNKQIVHDFGAKAFHDSVIMPNKESSGFVFFELDEKRSDLSGLNLEVKLKQLNTKETATLRAYIPGAVKIRKPESTEGEQ